MAPKMFSAVLVSCFALSGCALQSSAPAAAAGGGGSQGTSPAVWRYAQTITLDTTAAGANVPGDVENYPLAVMLDKSRFDFSQAQADGADIRFVDARGNALPHAIELWDRAGGSAASWVLLGAVKATAGITISASATRRSISVAADSGMAFWTRRASCKSLAARAARSSTTRASGRRRRSSSSAKLGR